MEKKRFAEIQMLIFRLGVSPLLPKTRTDALRKLQKNVTTATVTFQFVPETTVVNSTAVLQ